MRRTITRNEGARLLQAFGQEQVLRFWDDLDEAAREKLLAQVEAVDLEAVARMRKLLDGDGADGPATGFEPADVVPKSELNSGDARRAGEESLRSGDVGVVLVAGGQGTRLGFDGPKGAFPVGPVSDASLFEIHSRKILALERKFGTEIPFYVMTSVSNDGATRGFFEEHGFFGLSPGRVLFFKQGMWPALMGDGSMVLDGPDHLFMSPDGHGGVIRALLVNGMFDDMEKRGVRHLFYFQVDNPLVEIADPGFVGLHVRQDAEVSVKVCTKRDPGEGLGVVVNRSGRNAIVEYSELTDEQKDEKREDGRLKLLHGSVAIHMFSVDFLRQHAGESLPIHVAFKKVPCCDESGTTIKPETPNAYKFEQFIFDVLPIAENSLVVEFERANEFSPVKNASGSDSPATARADMVRKFAGWLEECGVNVPKDETGQAAHAIEIDPCYALGAEELRRKLGAEFQFAGDVLLRED